MGGVRFLPSGVASGPLSTLLEHLWNFPLCPFDRGDEMGVVEYFVP